MFTAALSILSGSWKQIVVGLAILSAVWYAYSWAFDRGAASRDVEIERLVGKHNGMVLAAERAAKTRQDAIQAKVDEQAKELDDEYRRNAELVLANSALQRTPVDPLRLRDSLATTRLAAAASAANAEAACHDRASSYEGLLAGGSQLLEEGARLAGDAAKAADDRRAEVKALINSWPK